MSEPGSAQPEAANDDGYHNVSHLEAAASHEQAARTREPEDCWVAMEATGRTPETMMDLQDELDLAWSEADEACDGDHGLVTPAQHLTLAAVHRRAAEAIETQYPQT